MVLELNAAAEPRHIKETVTNFSWIIKLWLQEWNKHTHTWVHTSGRGDPLVVQWSQLWASPGVERKRGEIASLRLWLIIEDDGGAATEGQGREAGGSVSASPPLQEVARDGRAARWNPRTCAFFRNATPQPYRRTWLIIERSIML
jgi:hypothetical protein